MNRISRRLARSVRSTQPVRLAAARARTPIEGLESRVFMSGSVLASVVHGTLSIRGDAAENAIVLDQVGLNADQVRVTGTDGTAINSQADPVILSGVTRGAKVRMGNAVDSVIMHDITLPRDVSVDAGRGGNVLTFSNVHVASSLTIKNGSAASTVTVADSTVGKNLKVTAGAGGQNVTLRAVEVQRGTSVASGGSGAAVMAIDDSTFHNSVKLRTGNGADVIQIDSRGASQGSPTLFSGSLSVAMGRGDDTLQLGVADQAGNHSTFAGKKTSLDGGSGTDTLANFDAVTNTGKRFRVKHFENNTVITGIVAPAVSSTNPANAATGIALNKKVAATFSTAMDPATITATTVTVTGPGQAAVAGTVAYVGTTATFTPASQLTANTVYTLKVTTGAKDLAGNPLAADFVSTFTTGATVDSTAPTVSSTDPANSGTGVALNKKIAVTFSEAMDPATITTTTFKVTGPGSAAVAGTVAYTGTTATFTPASSLAASTAYTVTVTTGAKDLAGNPLAAASVSTFTTGATADTTAPTVTSTNPADLKTNVALNKTVAATFSESMDPLTITAGNFTVKGPGNAGVAGTVSYDGPSKTAAFTPSSNLAPNTTYTATLRGGTNGAKDLAGNALASDKVWTFTTGTQVAQAPINLGAAAPFAVMATASISSTGATVINGDVGLNPGSAQGIPPAQVNGTIHVDDQAVIDAQADLLAAYNDAVSRTTTSVALPGNMGGLTFTPGLYTNSTSVLIQGSGPANNVTLDAQGDPNAIFIFKMGSTLTTGPGAQVILAGGAKAGNVFWQVGTSATLDTTTIFKGNILAAVSITVNNGSAVEGRLLGGSNSDGSVTIEASTVTVPAA